MEKKLFQLEDLEQRLFNHKESKKENKPQSNHKSTSVIGKKENKTTLKPIC